MHNKEYALKLIQEKINGLNNYSYSQISSLTGFTKRHLIRLTQELNKKDIDSILVHGLTNKSSNNSPSTKEIEEQKTLERLFKERDERLKARAKRSLVNFYPCFLDFINYNFYSNIKTTYS